MCFDQAYIDLTQFSSALIIGKIDGNDCYSNGVGKTSLFKAIEYVLFNQADVNLENIVRDESLACQIVLDFAIGEQEYRVSRSRSKKGSTDLTLLQRKSVEGAEDQVYHQITYSVSDSSYQQYRPYTDKKEIEKYWTDLSGSRAGDTEKDLTKLIKFTAKSFRSTVHFMQNDLTGLPTATSEKRKGILKDALSLLVYPKLEKIAKEKAGLLAKEIEKNKTLIEGLGKPDKELQALNAKFEELTAEIAAKQQELEVASKKENDKNEEIARSNTDLSKLESKFASLLTQKVNIEADKYKSETSVKEYTTKYANIVKEAKQLITDIKQFRTAKQQLSELDYTQIEILRDQIEQCKELIIQNNQIIKSTMVRYEELQVPLPKGGICEKCRKPMLDADRKNCQEHIAQEMRTLQQQMKACKEIIAQQTNLQSLQQQSLTKLLASKQQLEQTNQLLLDKDTEYQVKSEKHLEYRELLAKFKKDVENKAQELAEVQTELDKSSLADAEIIKQQIVVEKQALSLLTAETNRLHKTINHHNSAKAIVEHDIKSQTQNQAKQQQLREALVQLENKYARFPNVIQGFSSTGIPNLIIQDVLDDLQQEANTLLASLKPGLQLGFFVEKTKDDGEQADTLDIQYYVNGKERYYEQLSGAMRLAVAFSLKLGLSFVLQNRIGIESKFLLLDEIDQSLDKASVDAFSDIVKTLQKEFTILVITHNDRLKDKFTHGILVEQDKNMVSRAQVVSSW